MYINQKAVVRWRAFGNAMMNGGQVTRARVLLCIHGVFLLRLLRKLIDRSRVVGVHLKSHEASIRYKKNSKAS